MARSGSSSSVVSSSRRSSRGCSSAWRPLAAALAAATLLQLAAAAPRISLDDIVVALPVDEAHHTLAKASRVWRKGIRTFIASNTYPSADLIEEGKKHNETWVFYPDDNPKRSLYAGDTRAALVPFLAHKHFGDTYKWLLYGDDDTIFFVEGVIRLLSDFDHNLPYFITDHLWWTSVPKKPTHPNADAPRCLPCHFNDTGIDKTRATWQAPRGCPCTPKVLCDADTRGIFNQYCDIPRAPKVLYSMHGGAGGLISVGMLRAVQWDWMETCVKSLFSTGGDAFITICLWQAGYAHTDPGYSFYHPEVQQMDPGPEDRMGTMIKLARAMDSRCDEHCKHQLDNMLTLHVRSRMFPTLTDAAHFIKAISNIYVNYMELKEFHEEVESKKKEAEMRKLAATVDAAMQKIDATGNAKRLRNKN